MRQLEEVGRELLGQSWNCTALQKYGSPGPKTAEGVDGHRPVKSTIVWISIVAWREKKATGCSRFNQRALSPFPRKENRDAAACP